ncbi:MAG: O-antigen ligase-related protein [Parcubacteria group bacterium GW2011_GWA2_47_26]|nr:MAG: O-antigen ligase-related protein [Parcubacteria group bacterium GW2011_GWA2_47_26]
MLRLLKIILLTFFFALPLQTRWIFKQPIVAGVPYEYGTLSIFAVEALGWVIILLGILNMRGMVHSMRPHRIHYAALVLIALGFFSIILATDKIIALQAAVRLLEGILIYFVISTVAKRGGKIPATTQASGERFLAEWNPAPSSALVLGLGMTEWVGIAFIAGATLQAGLGIFQFLTQSSFASTILGMAAHDPSVLGTSVIEVQGTRWLRAYGGLPHPNVFGGYLVIALAVVVIMWQKSQMSQRWQRLVLQIAMPILLTGILFSFSRTAWLAVVFLLVYWFIGLLFSEKTFGETFHNAQNPTIVGFCARTRWVWLAVGYLVFLVSLYRPLVAVRIFSGIENQLEVKSRVERVEGLREAWQITKNHPLLGVGIGNYTQAIAREIRLNDQVWSYQPVHNVPLLIWAELGVIGLFLFLLILYQIFKTTQFYILHSTFYILLLFDHYLWTLPFGVFIFWSILGFSTRFTQPTDSRPVAL